MIPQALVDREIGHTGLTELHVVGYDARAQGADGRARATRSSRCPGGIGTLEELIEVYTWSQLGIHDKPLARAQHRRLLRRRSARSSTTPSSRASCAPSSARRLLVAPDPEALLGRWLAPAAEQC